MSYLSLVIMDSATFEDLLSSERLYAEVKAS
jgi:hypothetical protein